MKKFIASTIAFFSAAAATAGTVVFTAPEVTAIEEPARMGGSGAWIIPLIIGAALIFALIPRDSGTTIDENLVE